VIDAKHGITASKWAGQVWDATVAPARKLALERKNTIRAVQAQSQIGYHL
jgi:hypothetical protein